MGSAPSLGSQVDGSVSFDSNYAYEARSARRTGPAPKRDGPLRWFWVLLSLVLLAGMVASGKYMYENQYGHIHDHIDNEYNLYVAVWQAGELHEFYNMHWMLIVDDYHTIDLERTAETTKVPKTVLGTKVKRNLTVHVEYSVPGILPTVFYSPEERDVAESHDPAKWKRVKPAMFNHQNFRLRGTHEASGYTSWVTLEDYPFVRHGPEVPGLTSKQCEARQGWYDGGVCKFMEYLTEVCIRVMVDPESYSPYNFDVDYTHAAAGCYPEDGLKVPQYTVLPHVAGEAAGVYYLPESAKNSTRMVLRHAHDPELMEKVLKHEMFQELRMKKQRFILGVGGLLLCVLLLVPVWGRASPVTGRLTRKMYLRWRYPHASKQDDGQPSRSYSVMSV